MKRISVTMRRLLFPFSLIACIILYSHVPPEFVEKMKREAEWRQQYDSLNRVSLIFEDGLFNLVPYEILIPAKYQEFRDEKGKELYIWHDYHFAEMNDGQSSTFYFWIVCKDTLKLFPKLVITESTLPKNQSASKIINNGGHFERIKQNYQLEYSIIDDNESIDYLIKMAGRLEKICNYNNTTSEEMEIFRRIPE